MKDVFLILLVCVSVDYAVSRKVVQTLTVNNGQQRGTWRKAQFCPEGKYAVGYKMKIEKPLGLEKDDTSLNAIQLKCGDGATITSGAGEWGNWSTSFTQCGPRQYLVAFNLQVERFQGIELDFDDTSANYVKFLCRDYYGGDTTVKVQPPGKGKWGTYGGWSRSCEPRSAICGLQTRVEAPQGVFRDDTALNDVRFLCCNDSTLFGKK